MNNCQLYYDHLLINVCDRDEGKFNELLDWMALVVQHPDQKLKKGLYFHGLPGVGRTQTALLFTNVIGAKCHHMCDYKQSFKFNDFLENITMLLIDGEHVDSYFLKEMLTAKYLRIEKKGKDPFFIQNDINVIRIGNYGLKFDVSFSRRFLAFHIKDNMVLSHTERLGLFYQLNQRMISHDGVKILKHDLETRLVDRFRYDWC